MTETTFRQKQERTEAKPQVAAENTNTSVVDEPVPYSQYEQSSKRPFFADHFSLGDYWEAFDSELKTINSYFDDKVHKGELADNQDSIKAEIKKIEKMLNLKDEARTVIKIGTIAAHVKFLQEKNSLIKEFSKHANT